MVVTIPKPGKEGYSLAESCRCVSLLNCLGMMEKVAAELVGAHSDQVRGCHPGPYRYRKGRSVVDAVGATIAQVGESWGRGCILRMDVAAASPVWRGGAC